MSQVSPAPLGRRLGAAAIDLAITLGIVGLGALRESRSPSAGLFLCVGFVMAGVFWLVRDTGGASPGKRGARLTVLRADGAGVGSMTSARRNIVLGTSLLLSGAGALLSADPFGGVLASLSTVAGVTLGLGAIVDAVPVFIGSDARRLSERWARTRVVRT